MFPEEIPPWQICYTLLGHEECSAQGCPYTSNAYSLPRGFCPRALGFQRKSSVRAAEVAVGFDQSYFRHT